MALTDKERTRLVTEAYDAIKAAKSKKDIVAVWEDPDCGYGVLGHKALARLLLGKSVEEATAKRGKKDN